MSTAPSALDAAALAPYLERRVEGFRGLKTVSKFDTGQSNPTYLIVAQSGRYVLRAKPPGQLLKSAHQVDREYRVMAALAGSAVPVPPVLHLSGDDSPIGRQFFVMRHVPGRIFWDPALPDLSPGERAAVYDAMNATLAALHDIDIKAAGLSDFGRPGNYFARQLARWTGQYRAAQTDDLPGMEELIPWLEARLPADDGQVALVHGDYRLDNIIFEPDAPRIAAVLDWELSTLGHPFADIAYQCMQWRLSNRSELRGLGGLDRASLGIPTEQEYVAAYCRRRGLAGIGDWTFHLAFAFFRLAAIGQGVYRRALEGNASNPQKALPVRQIVLELSTLGAGLVRESR